MIQACLFDIGNVLVSFDYSRAFPSIAHRTERTLEELLVHLRGAGAALESGQLSSEEFIDAAQAFLGNGVSREAFLSAFTGIFELNTPVWELVTALRGVVPLYLFSNTSEIHESWLFERWPEFRLFHGGFYSWRLGTMKPEPGMYEAAIRSLGVPPEAIAYIDDLPANVAMGNRYGFRSHQYDRERHSELLAFLTECGLPAPAEKLSPEPLDSPVSGV